MLRLRDPGRHPSGWPYTGTAMLSGGADVGQRTGGHLRIAHAVRTGDATPIRRLGNGPSLSSARQNPEDFAAGWTGRGDGFVSAGNLRDAVDDSRPRHELVRQAQE